MTGGQAAVGLSITPASRANRPMTTPERMPTTGPVSTIIRRGESARGHRLHDGRLLRVGCQVMRGEENVRGDDPDAVGEAQYEAVQKARSRGGAVTRDDVSAEEEDGEPEERLDS